MRYKPRPQPRYGDTCQLALVVSVFNAIFFRELSQLPAQCNPVPPGVVNSLRQICRDPFLLSHWVVRRTEG